MHIINNVGMLYTTYMDFYPDFRLSREFPRLSETSVRQF